MNHKWRLFGTALSFTVFGLGSIVLGAILFPILILLKPLFPVENSARLIIHKSFKAFILMMKTMGVLDYIIEGDKGFLNEPGTLVLANHPTLLDVVFLISMMPNANCVIKRGLRNNIFTWAIVRSANYISNDNPEDIIRECVNSLQNSDCLIIFPEGTRSKHEKLNKFRRGAAQIALRSGVKITTIIISCNPGTLSKEEKWYQIPDQKPVFKLKIMPPDRCLQNLIKLGYNQKDWGRAARNFNAKLLEYYRAHL